MIKIRNMKANDRTKIYEILQQDDKYNPEQILHRIDLFLFDPYQRLYKVIIAEEDKKLVLGCLVFGPDPQAVNSYQIFNYIQSSIHNNNDVLFLLLKNVEKILLKRKTRIIISEISSHSRFKQEYETFIKLNYSVTSRINNFYSEGDNKLILTKNLL